MIKFENIDLKFDGKILFQNFNMDISKGEKILLRAPSGKGKSTLIKLLLGFIKQDKGDILYNKQKLSKDNVHYFRKNIAYVSQDIDLRNKIVWDLITEIFSYKLNKNITVTKDKVMELFNYFELPEGTLHKEVKQLSGGQRQRLGLIICILLDREVWLLDEITSGLDNKLKEKVARYVLDQDKTILIVSHDDVWIEQNNLRIEEL